MNATASKRFVFEANFRDHLVDRLWDAGIPAITERPLSKNGDQNSLLRTDILVGRYPQGSEVIIECKINTDSQSLCTALGQALIYQNAFDANKSVICFPQDVMIPELFLEVCEKHEVTVTTDEALLDAVDPRRTLRNSDCFGAMSAALQGFNQCLRSKRFDQWPEDSRRILKNELRWFADLYKRL